jgi:hypothetical protein
MQCPRCQQDNPLPDAHFCPRCGAPVGRVEESGPPAASYADLRRDLTEALEQQTATSEILRIIAQAKTDVQPVFDIIGERAEQLCDAAISMVSRFDGEQIHLVALHGVTGPAAEVNREAFPQRPDDETLSARAVRSRAVAHVADVLTSISPISERIPSTGVRSSKRWGFARCWRSPCCVMANRSACCHCGAARSGRSRTSRSCWWRPLPTRPAEPPQSSAVRVVRCRHLATGRSSASPRRPSRPDPGWADPRVHPLAGPRDGRRSIGARRADCPGRRHAG